jgi:hypothetical protein
MENRNLNPIYRNFLVQQTIVVPVEKTKHNNNWKKAILAIFIIGILLATIGVPVYNVVFAIEGNAIPFESGNILLTPNSNSRANGQMGNIIAFEIWNWGATPSVKNIEEMLTAAGLGIAAYIVGNIAYNIYLYLGMGGSLTASALASIIWMSASMYFTWPVVLGIAVTLVAA